jgi:hypothetical protein
LRAQTAPDQRCGDRSTPLLSGQLFQLDQKDMLESLRKRSGGLIAKIFIGLLVLSFAIWGIGDMFRGASERELAEVGSVKIDTETFRQLYQERLQQVSRQIGRGLTPTRRADWESTANCSANSSPKPRST